MQMASICQPQTINKKTRNEISDRGCTFIMRMPGKPINLHKSQSDPYTYLPQEQSSMYLGRKRNNNHFLLLIQIDRYMFLEPSHPSRPTYSNKYKSVKTTSMWASCSALVHNLQFICTIIKVSTPCLIFFAYFSNSWSLRLAAVPGEHEIINGLFAGSDSGFLVIF